MEQYGGIQLNPIGKDPDDIYQTAKIGLSSSTLSGAQAAYNLQGVGFDDSQNTQNATRYNPQELTSSRIVNPKELQNQSEIMAHINKEFFL